MVSPDTRDDPDPAKINYRSMGRGHGGVLTKRRPRYVRDFSKPVTSTIPPKFETVLYRNNCEKRAFGLHTPRFVDQRAEEQPGPGSYAGPGLQNGIGGLESQAGGSSASGSVGIRGNNAFATRAPRLPRPKVQGAPPGPGAYEAEALAHDSARPTASFVVPDSVNPLKFYARPSPGPGEYVDGSHAWTARGPRRSTNVCISQAGVKTDGRLELPGEASGGPGPGHYDAASSPRASSLPPKGWTIGSSKRRLVQHASDPAEQPIQSLLKAGAEMITDKTAEVLPGPGDYDPQTSEAGPRHSSNRGLSSFQSGLSHLPRSWRPPPPGPGEYEAPAAEPPAAPARAVFASASPRFREKAPRAPGPAYYEPRRRALKDSYHLNLKGGWV